MNTYELEYTPEPKSTLEGMKLAGKLVFNGRNLLLLWAQTLVVSVFAPAGIVAVILLIMFTVTGDVALPVPISAFETPDEAQMAFEQMIAWHQEATS